MKMGVIVSRALLPALAIAGCWPVLASAQNTTGIKPARTQLGGRVVYGPESFERVSPAGRLRACESPPFTAQEIERIAGRRLSVLPAGANKRPRKMILFGDRARGNRRVELNDYLREINAVERFYNQHGLTLRSGPLALRGPRPEVACRSRDDIKTGALGMPMIRYRLVEAPTRGGDARPGEPHIDPSRDMPELKPNPPGPGDVMGIDVIAARINPGFDTRALTELGRKRFAGERQFSVDLTPDLQTPLLKTMSGSACPPQACAMTFDKNTFLSAAGRALVERPDEVLWTKWGCTILTASANNAANCPVIDGVSMKFKIQDITRRMDWEAKGLNVDVFLQNFRDPCAVRPKIGEQFFADLYESSGDSAGQEVELEGTAAPTFFDGILAYQRKGVADCALDVGSNGLFSARICLTYGTSNKYSPDAGIDIHNAAGLDVSASLFGFDFDLAKGDAHIDWKQPTNGTGFPALVQPTVASTLEQKNETEHYEGPSATFAAGPIPITVRSFADVRLALDKPLPKFVPPPLRKDVPGTGTVGMAVGSQASMDVTVDAAVDAFVLSAGVSGKLNLIDTSLSAGVFSELTPAQNQLRVRKQKQATISTLKGTLSAFVEVDLLVYSERYTFEIVSFDGVQTQWPLAETVWGPASAVLPESVGPASGCPKTP